MTELIIWITTHPDVKVRCHKDSILDSLVIRVIKGRYISEHAMDALECQLYFSANEKQRTDLIIAILNNLYDNLEEVENDAKNNLFYTHNINTVNNDLVLRDSITGGNIGYIDGITTEIDPYTGFSAEITVTNKKAYDQIINLYMGGSREAEHVTPRKYQIKRVVVNPSKNATTVIFEDGTVEVVKKSPDDPEADIFSVVAYAVAKHVYGSNSAFKREVLKNLDFIDRDFEKIIDRTSCEDLAKAMRKVFEYIKNKNRKENDNDA